jgi:hypothetical protein
MASEREEEEKLVFRFSSLKKKLFRTHSDAERVCVFVCMHEHIFWPLSMAGWNNSCVLLTRRIKHGTRQGCVEKK